MARFRRDIHLTDVLFTTTTHVRGGRLIVRTPWILKALLVVGFVALAIAIGMSIADPSHWFTAAHDFQQTKIPTPSEVWLSLGAFIDMLFAYLMAGAYTSGYKAALAQKTHGRKP